MRIQSMWSPERGWLWWSRHKHDYTIPDVREDGAVWNHHLKRYEMLDLITMGRMDQPWKLLIHGPPGAGKTTIANSFPKVVAADLEGSTERYEMARLDLRNAPLEVYASNGQVDKSATSVMNFLRTLGREEHDYQTLAVDTLDWLEPKIWEATCKRLGIQSMESLGYGKAYLEADEEWEKFINALNFLHRKRSMHIVLLAHTTTKTVNDKDFNEFQRHDIKLQKRAAAKFVEWAEIIGFLTYDTYVHKRNGKETSRHDGERVLIVQEDGQYVAKNRFGYQGEPIKPTNYTTLREKLYG